MPRILEGFPISNGMNTIHFKELLEKERGEIEKELATVGRKNPDQAGDWEATEPEGERDFAEEGDRAEGIENFENNNAVLFQLETRLKEVNAALEKIEDGTYGICEVSGEPIEEDRLEANPAATTCKTHMN